MLATDNGKHYEDFKRDIPTHLKLYLATVIHSFKGDNVFLYIYCFIA